MYTVGVALEAPIYFAAQATVYVNVFYRLVDLDIVTKMSSIVYHVKPGLSNYV